METDYRLEHFDQTNIINLFQDAVNNYLHSTIMPGDFEVTLDLAVTYLLVLTAKLSYKYLQFSIQERVFQFQG